MAMKISISFKDHEKCMYDFLVSQLSPSIYIKQLIKNEMKSNSKEEPVKKPENRNILDF